MKIGTTLILQTVFDKLEKETLEQLRAVAERRHYPAGAVLCHQGEIEHTFYIIVEGRVMATQRLEDGEERVLNTLGPRQYFGEMGLLDDTPRMATCTTLGPTTVLEVTEKVFDKLVEESPALAYTITRHLLSTLRNIDELAIQDLTAKNEALQKAYAELKAAQAKLVEKERLERELELAADVQRSLLPGELPPYPDYEFADYLRPARQVGGDFYDVIHLDEEHVGLLMADVADKGFHAALFMAVTHTLFRGECRDSLSPAEVTLAVHRGMLDVASTNDVFVTAFYGVLHRPSGRLTYVRAGHDRPLWFRPGQPVEKVEGEGRFLGMLQELHLQEYTMQLQPGDRLVLFSDGVPDATNKEGEQYGNGRLAATVAANGPLSAAGLVENIAEDVTRWCRGAPPFDDLTLLVVAAKRKD